MPPPQHRADAPMNYISRSDPAWDRERWTAEIDPLEGEDLDAHPLMAYWSGTTRFDLDVPTPSLLDESRHVSPRDYLLPDQTPRVWVLRPMKVGEMSTCLDRGGRTGEEWAFRLSVKGLEGGPEGMLFQPPKLGGMKDVHVETVSQYLGADVIYDVGRAALAASRQPSEQEKKL